MHVDNAYYLNQVNILISLNIYHFFMVKTLETFSLAFWNIQYIIGIYATILFNIAHLSS
jgi:hypothetical protein